MIHIAPCSCELHQALREALDRNAKLEAELAELTDLSNRTYEGRKLDQARIQDLLFELAAHKDCTPVFPKGAFRGMAREREAD